MSKVIIVTRTNAYDGNSLFNPKSYSTPKCYELTKFIYAITDWKKRLRETDEIAAYKKVMNEELRGVFSSKNFIEVISKLMDEPAASDFALENCPYSCYNNGDFYICCVWCDTINITDKVEPFEVFIKSICNDIGVVFDENNEKINEEVMLFVHDNQIGEEGEAVIIDDYNVISNSIYSDFLKQFKRAARFKHTKGKTIFGELIWNWTFGGSCTWLENEKMEKRRRRQ